MDKSVLFIIPCGRYFLSGVFRALDYFPLLKNDGYRLKAVSYNSPRVYKWLHIDNGLFSFLTRKGFGINLNRYYNFFKSVYILLIARNYDLIFIQQSLPPQWWVRLLKRINDRIIYDIDDAVFLQLPQKSRFLIKNSTIISCGSHFILEHIQSINKNSILLPTPVPNHLFNTPQKINQDKTSLNIGWIGTPGNINYLSILEEPIRHLSKKYPDQLSLTFIGPSRRCETMELFASMVEVKRFPFIDPQRISNYIKDFDIGVMPLFDGDWEKAKCASKALVYMASSVPVVCSRVGENEVVIEDGVNGYLASDSDEWIEKLTRLIEDPELRSTLGRQGRKTVETRYSTEVCYKILKDKILIPALDPNRTC